MRLAVVAGLAAVAVGALSGCQVSTYAIADGPTVARTATERLTEFAGRAPDAVECADDLDLKVGVSTRCTLTDGGTRYGVTVTVTTVADDGNADLDIQVDEEPLP
ncbi:hypothetical protein GCM10009559_56650 [Pseudonocardia zijingensis]|uniref:DUF4333 domain-containing protein n=2 Tax=Pseudonocardia zijingensis TaxID=153376 RepID=A0ABN1N863_9PSEU